MQASLDAVASPRRRAILRLVWDRELPAGEIAAQLDVSWPATSQHLRVLCDAGLLTQRKAGHHRLYQVNREAIGPLEPLLHAMWTADLEQLRQVVERDQHEGSVIGRPIEIETRIAAPPDVVFGYFVDPELYCRWKGSAAQLEPRPGGLYRVAMPSGDIVRGKYVEVQRPARVVFTWGFEGNAELPPGSSVVEVTLQADGDGTIVRLRHDRLPSDISREQHAVGWRHYVDRLAIAAAGDDPGPDWN